MKKLMLAVMLLSLVVLPNTNATRAQDDSNDIAIFPRVVHGGDPASTFDYLKALPVVAFADTHVSHEGQFANRHDWAISADGEEPTIFGIDDYFDFSFDLVLFGSPITPRKEAGIIVTSSVGGEGQFIVNTDANEVVTFGGPLPFYSFNAQEGDQKVVYNSGDKINLRLRYFMDRDGLRKVEYYANGKSSGALEITNNEQGIPGPFFVKGYMQTVISTANPNNRAITVFDSIRWNGKLVGN